MNTRLKTIVTFALVVVLSAGLAMAGRGGGGGGHGGGGGGGSRSGGGGGGYRGGAGGGGGGYHTPSFSTPRQSFSALAARPDVSVAAIVAAECRGQPVGLYAKQPAGHRRAAWNCQHAHLGQPPERRESSEHQQSCEYREPGLRRKPSEHR